MKSPLDQCCCGLIFLLLDGHRMEKESDMNNIGGSSRYEFTKVLDLPMEMQKSSQVRHLVIPRRLSGVLFTSD